MGGTQQQLYEYSTCMGASTRAVRYLQPELVVDVMVVFNRDRHNRDYVASLPIA